MKDNDEPQLNRQNEKDVSTKEDVSNHKIYTPNIYVLTHIVIGFVGYHSISVGILFLLYQAYQLLINRRFFLLPQWLYESETQLEGNTLGHTINKIGQALIGYSLAFLITKVGK